MKNIKAILWDVDGVIITNVYAFSKHLQEHYLDSKDDMLDFFLGDFRETSIGNKDLKEILYPRLAGWNWNLGVDKFIDFWFLSEARTNPKILGIMMTNKKQGIITCIASNQERYRKNFLLKDVGLDAVIDKGYFSCDLGVCKPDPKYYEMILADLGLNADEIFVIDDDEKNIKSAKNIGMNGIFYESFDDVKDLF